MRFIFLGVLPPVEVDHHIAKLVSSEMASFSMQNTPVPATGIEAEVWSETPECMKIAVARRHRVIFLGQSYWSGDQTIYTRFLNRAKVV